MIALVSAALLPALLILTGWSAAEAAYYLNQNARSLIHRYHTQERRIIRWFATLKGQFPIADLSSMPIDAAAKNEAGTQILEFEDLMIEELIDWIHISRHDVIEIAPKCVAARRCSATNEPHTTPPLLDGCDRKSFEVSMR